MGIRLWEKRGGQWTAKVSYGTATPGYDALDEDALLALFDATDAPTAVFGLRDYEAWLAQGILLRRRPDLATQVEIVGYGNTPWSQASHVPFSTVDYDFETIVEKAVAIIERVRNEGETDNTPLLVKPNLFIREPNHEAA